MFGVAFIKSIHGLTIKIDRNVYAVFALSFCMPFVQVFAFRFAFASKETSPQNIQINNFNFSIVIYAQRKHCCGYCCCTLPTFRQRSLWKISICHLRWRSGEKGHHYPFFDVIVVAHVLDKCSLFEIHGHAINWNILEFIRI